MNSNGHRLASPRVLDFSRGANARDEVRKKVSTTAWS